MNSERPVSAVLHDIAGNLEEIVRAELRLAKRELGEELGRASAGGLMLVAGVAMVGVAGVFALLALVYALSLVMPAWGAALIVAGGEAVMAAIFIGVGLRKLKTMRVAPRTRATVQENIEWAKQQTT